MRRTRNVVVRCALAIMVGRRGVGSTIQVALASDLQFRDTQFRAGTVVDHHVLESGERWKQVMELEDEAEHRGAEGSGEPD